MDDILNEMNIEQISSFEEEEEKKSDIKIEQIQKNPDEALIKLLFKDINANYTKDNRECLYKKTNDLYTFFSSDQNANIINTIKIIFSIVSKYYKDKFSQIIIQFFDYVLSVSSLKFEILQNAINKKPKENGVDIIFFWEKEIAEQQLKEYNIIIPSEQMKNNLFSLLNYDFSFNEIYYIINLFKKVINIDKPNQLDIFNSLISILMLYPNIIKEDNPEVMKQNEIYLQEFIDKYIIQIGNKFIFDENKNIALDFYLLLSSYNNKSNFKQSSELDTKEIFKYLKNNNPNINDNFSNLILNKLEIIISTMNNREYSNYGVKELQNWTKTVLPILKINDKQNVDAKMLGMISLAIKINRGYFLRKTQLVAILLFIYKKKEYGLIEEISTGEGKSCIISSLSIFCALWGHKVDIISSSYTLAQRDSDEFRDLYNCFNLTTGYPCNSQSKPYQTDILYGTFLEFEGDYLREIIDYMNIRKGRPFDVIIIDEVDNLFIDNILGSTELTNSSLGFKFLILIYLTIYFNFELSDYFFLLFFQLSLANIENEGKKKKFERIFQNPEERKKEMIKIMQGNLAGILEFQESNKKIDNNKELNDKIDEMENNFDKLVYKLKKYLEFPDFLKSFVEEQYSYWFDSAYDAKNIMDIDRDYVEIINRSGNRDIAPVDIKNTGEIEMNTVYEKGLHQMLEIKHQLRVNDETLVHTFLSHITFFQKYKSKNQFLFFGLTGTIGDKETQKIYGNNYFNSKLLFIPQYKKKKIC